MSLPRARAQRRALVVLTLAQVLSGAGLAAGVTVGALLARDMLGSTSLAGLLSAVSIAGSAAAAVVVGRVSQARGRRRGLAAGYLAGAVGSAGVVAAAVVDSAVLLFAMMAVYGAGTATNLQARYAGADLAADERRGRAVSTVLVATTLGGVVGPVLVTPTGDLGQALGVPRLAGLFLLSGAGYATAALVLAVWLRPDPLLLARAWEAERAATAEASPAPAPSPSPSPSQSPSPSPAQSQSPSRSRSPSQPPSPSRAPEPVGGPGGPAGERPRRGVLVGALVMVLTQLVMVAVMTMTPVHMQDHGQGTGATGLVIAVHIGAMYLPAPLSGWLVDRHGRFPVAVASAVVLLAAGIGAGQVPGGSAAGFAAALALLGLGWNLGIVSGTAIVTDSVPLARRARTQGSVDLAVALAGAVGGTASGVVVATAGYPLLAGGCGVLALATVLVVVAAARAR